MSDIRFNQWLHQSGTGGVSQVASGAVGVGTTNPLADFYVRGDAQITGILTAGHIAMGSSITFGDNDRIYLGDGTDFQLYHSSSDNNSYIVESGAGSLVVNASKFHVKNAANNEDVAVFNQSGNNELYFSNSKKFETTNTGAVVTGILTATGNVNIAHGTGQAHYQITQTNGNTVKFGIVSGSDIELSGSSNNSMYFKTANTERLRITGPGLISIGDESNLDSQLTVTQAQGDCIRLRSNATNNTFKYGIIKQEPYNNNALGVQIIGGKSDSGYSEVAIGGGIDGGYAATHIDFYTGATTTTTTGTRRLRINSVGNLVQTLDTDAQGFKQTNSNNHYIYNIIDVNRSAADDHILIQQGRWNGKNVAAMKFRAGADTSNKDDGHITFETSSANNQSERVRITSAGLVGIGIDAPVGNLEIRDTKANLIVAKDGLTVKGNSDLHTTYDIIQLGAGGGLASYSTATATADTHLVHNAYRHSGGSWKYKYADTAMRLRMNSPGGAFIFDSAASGSAGATVSFTEKVRIDSSGHLRIGNTTQTFMDGANNLVVGGGSGSEGITIYGGSSDGGFIAFADGTSDPAYRMGQIIYDHGANEMLFRTNGNTNRFIIKSNGYAEFTGASDLRLTLGSTGTAGTNSANWLRASGADLMYNAASGSHKWEIGGAEYMRLTTFTDGTHSTTSGVLGINDSSPGGEALGLVVKNKAHQDSNLPVVHIERVNNHGGGSGTNEIALNVTVPRTHNNANDVYTIKSYAEHNLNATHYAGYFEAKGSQYDAGGDGAAVYATTHKTDTNGHGYVPCFYAYGRSTYNANSNGYAVGMRIKLNAYEQNVGILIHHELTNSNWTPMITFRKGSGANGTEVGSIKSSNNATQYNTSSDYRLKENVVDLTGAITRLKQLKPKRFNFKNDTSKTVDGFLAHEVETSCPQAVSGTKDAVKIETVGDPSTGKTIMNEDGTPKIETVIDPQEVDYSKLSTLTIAALQEALAKIETLEAKVAALEGS